MEPTIRVRLGDLFEGPSDMLVVPCSTMGTISGFVAQSLAQYAIPRLHARMPLGNVTIFPFKGADDLAQYIAFAATVQAGGSSTPDAIGRIGAKLGKFTREKGLC